MSVWMVLTHVLLMQPAIILMVVITVPVTQAMREMVLNVQVCLIMFMHDFNM